MENIRCATHLKYYEAMLEWIENYLGRLTDEDLQNEIVPGLNHGVFILGHLIASDDDLSLYLGKGELLYPDYQKMFAMSSQLIPVADCPPASQLRQEWENICKKNRKIYAELKDDELDEPHHQLKGPVEEDWLQNKENVVIHWSSHQVYHCGQLGMLCSKLGKRFV